MTAKHAVRPRPQTPAARPEAERGGPPPRSGKRRWTKERKLEAAAGYAFLAPWLVGLLVITIVPFLSSLYLSFTEYNAGGTPEWVGVENFVRMSEDPRYFASLRVTVFYVVVSVPLLLAFALFLAMVLNTGLRGLAIYRSLYYLPSLLGGSVAIAVLWRQLFGTEGIVNGVLGFFGIEGPAWLSEPAWAPFTLILLNVWTFGAPMVIFLAGLRQIPQELYDAAAVDGAGRASTFWHITLPQLSPVLLFNGILTTIGAFQAFTGAYVISGGQGGPVDSTLFYTLYLYQTAFSYFEFGYASAMAWVLLLLIAAVTVSIFGLSRRFVFYGDGR